jgi:LysM repeat protein
MSSRGTSLPTAALLTAALLAAALLLAAPGVAGAYPVHQVAPGESLTSIAALDGLSVEQLAAANGLSPAAELLSGQEIEIPPQGVLAPAATGSSGTAATTTATASTTGTAGAYLVQPGDTLSAIAARAGTTVAALAALNGLDPDGLLFAGSMIALPGTSSGTEYVSASTSTPGEATAEGQPVGAAAEGTPGGPPYPTDETVSGGEIAGIAEANGVPPALAEAVGWQESGWNNDEVSVDDAIGVMQILPGTWSWIDQTLTAGAPLAPASAADNVRGGVLLLHALLDSTGGSSAEAAAGYYQGLSSVQQYGMYPETQQYVNDVMSLEQQFGGG